MELASALAELFPGPGGPTVDGILAQGLLVPTVDKKRLRLPPPSPSELHQRLMQPANTPSALTGGPPLFSYFDGPITNIQPRNTPITLRKLYQMVVSPPPPLRQQLEAIVSEYRTNGKSARYKALKNRLDYVTMGGIFSHRADKGLQQESGLIVLDFDGLGGQLAQAREALLHDHILAPALGLLFVSPSGDGLKVVLAADPTHSRRINYERIGAYLNCRYGWGPTLDKQTADLSRACFLSHLGQSAVMIEAQHGSKVFSW
ncbi:MAG: hypothetical protein EOO61_12495 [Hymenobacter sp.]|nr:MAG: hypothetical protein EOO61_12495 [Hymenobacter sp.]